MNTSLREYYMQHAPLMQRCVDEAFDDAIDLSMLDDSELAALLNLQGSIYLCRETVWYLLPELKGEDWQSMRGDTIKAVLKRFAHAKDITLFIEGLCSAMAHKECRTAVIKKLDGFVKNCLDRDTLTESESIALILAFASLRHNDLKYNTGKALVHEVWKAMLKCFTDNSSWPNISLTEALTRLETVETFDVRSALDIDQETVERIFSALIIPDNEYTKDDFLKIVNIRTRDYQSEGIYCPDKDFARVLQLLSCEGNRQRRWQEMLALINLLRFIHGEEATIISTLPESTAIQYFKVAKAKDYANMSDPDLIAEAEDCFGLMVSLEDYIDRIFFSHDNRAEEAAVKICDELARRGTPEMRHIAGKIGYSSHKLPSEETDWVLGLDDIVAQITDEAVESRSCKSLSDSDLYAYARLLATMHSETDLHIGDSAKLDMALENCFTELWTRFCSNTGDISTLYDGIKSIYDTHPKGLDGFDDILKDAQADLVKWLLEVREKEPAFGIRALEIAAASPLCKVIDDGIDRRYADTIGIDLYLKEVTRWASSQKKDGSWPGVGIDEALRRIRLLENDYPHTVKGLDYSDIIRKAFNYYSGYILTVDLDGISEMRPASLGAIDLFADCYFNLWNPSVTDITPAHLCRYVLPALDDDSLSLGARRVMQRIVILAHLRQQEKIGSCQVLDYHLN